MIEHLDKQTQPLPLDQKRGRGRPATGKALSNAERQRAYRERHKAQRNEKSETHEVPYEEVVAIAQELGERCKAAEAKLRVELELGEKARKRVKELEAQLAQRNEKPAEHNSQLSGGKRTGITPCRRAPSCAAAARPGRWPSASAGA